MSRTTRAAAATLILILVAAGPLLGQATGNGDGSKTGDGTTPFTGLAQAPEANLFLGSATTNIRIEVPPGRNAMTPQLALNYTSNGGPSPYGHGWDLSLPSLRRTTKHGVLSCSDTSVRNEFVLTLPGTSIECTLIAGVCKPHVESGFIRIQSVADTNGAEFKVTDKSGISYTFGGSGAVTTNWTGTFTADGGRAVTGSTLTNGFEPSTCTYIATWALTRIEDPNGNYIDYRYVRDGGTLYPLSISYGAHASGPTQHVYGVSFIWETRSDDAMPPPSTDVDDVVLNALGGFPAIINYRLKRINVALSPATLIRGYNFSYEEGRKGRQTFLESVSLIGDNNLVLERADGEVAATVFLYRANTDATAGFETVSQTVTRPALLDPEKSLRVREDSGTRRDVMDLNGDGFPDLIDAAIGVQCKPDGANPSHRFWTVYFGSKVGFSVTPTRWYLPPTSIAPACIIQGVLNGEEDLNHTRFTTIDMTGDGIPDYVDGAISTVGGIKQWAVYPGTPNSPYGSGWGFGSALQWKFAAGEGASRDYTRRVAPSIPVSDLGGFTGNVSVVYQDLLDMNGDGLPDLVRTCGTSCTFTTNWEVYLNRGDGTGFHAREYFTGRFQGLTVTSNPPAGTIYTVADVNGDGLPDQVMGVWWDSFLPFEYEVCLNSGHAMNVCSDVPVPPRDNGALIHENFNGPQDTIREFVDMNGDGLPDIVDRGGWNPTDKDWRVFLNRGSSFELSELPWPAPRSLIREGTTTSGVTRYDTFDIDGDGMVDFVDFYNDNAAMYKIHRPVNGAWTSSGSPRTSAARPDLLVVSENGIGSRTMLSYRPSTAWDNDGGDSVVDLPFNVWTVTEVCQDDGMGVGSCVTPVGGHQVGAKLTYASGRFDPIEREFRGFGIVIAIAVSSAGGPPPRGTLTTYHQTSALGGKLAQRTTYDAGGSGSYLAATANVWQCVNLSTHDVYPSASCPANPGWPGGPAAGLYWVRLSAVHETTSNTSAPAGNRVVSTVNDEWHECDGGFYGNVKASHRGESGQPQLRTYSEYACPTTTSAYIVDRPIHVKVTGDAVANVLEERWMRYDGADYGAPVTKGNLTEIEAWIDQDLGLGTSCSQQAGAKCASSTMSYDAGNHGLVVAMTDPNMNQTGISFDGQWLYPETVTHAANNPALAYKTTSFYDLKCGKLAQQTMDYKGSTVPPLTDRWRNTYDPYCRLKTVYRPGEDSSIVTVPYRTYAYKLGAPGMATATIIDSREPNNTAGGIARSSVLADGLGRVIQRKAHGVVDGVLQVIATTSAYDSASNQSLQLVPEALAASTSFETYTPPGGSVGTSTMLYDAGGRLTKVTHPDGKFRTFEHNIAWQTTIKDECHNDSGCVGSQIVEKRDAFGNTIERIESDEAAGVKAAMRYQYDELGRRTASTQGDGTTWNAATTITTDYDSLGRIVTVTDPDAGPTGPSAAAGVWFYGYDLAGNLRYQDDPTSSRHIQFCYDGLNRVTKKKYLRSGDYAGLASCAANASEQITYEYDTALDGVGRLYRVTDLSGVTSINAYTKLGQPRQMVRAMDGVSATTQYWYDSADHLIQEQYPDGESVGYRYDAVGRVKGVGQTSLNPVYLTDMTYDVFGRPRTLAHANGTTDTRAYETTALKNYRLKQIKAVTGATTHFQYDYKAYDAGGRLTEIDDTTPGLSPTSVLNADATFTYDGLGRLLTAEDVAPGTRSYAYDLWGNITSKEGTTIAYDGPKPHVPTVASGTDLASFAHDDNGNRANRTMLSSVLDYQYDMDDRLRLIDAGSEGVEFTYDYTGRRTKEIRGSVITDGAGVKTIDPAGAVVTHHYTDRLEVTRYPGSPDTFELRKYYFADDLLIASRETTSPPQLQVASADGDALVQVASLFTGGGPALVLQLGPEAARAAGVAALLALAFVVCLPGRKRPAVVGIHVRPADAAILAIVLTLGSLPWPLLVRPAQAQKGPGPTPTPVTTDQIHHYHLDHLGSPQVITLGTGSVVKQIRYTPYGEVRNGAPYTEWDDREFTGYEKEPLSGHSYAGARFYDPDFALFLSHDPEQQFASPYTYTNWNPIGRSDPNGAAADAILGPEIAATAAAAETAGAASAGATPADSGTGADVSADGGGTIGESSLGNTHSRVFLRATITPEGEIIWPDGTNPGASGVQTGGLGDGGSGYPPNGPGGMIEYRSSVSVLGNDPTPADIKSGNAVLTSSGALWTGRAAVPPVEPTDIVAAAGLGTKLVIRGGTALAKTAAEKAAEVLAKRAASEEGVTQVLRGAGKIIAGPGAKLELRAAGRLARDYGGSPEQWVKVTSTARGQRLQTHAYQNLATGEVVELKSILP